MKRERERHWDIDWAGLVGWLVWALLWKFSKLSSHLFPQCHVFFFALTLTHIYQFIVHISFQTWNKCAQMHTAIAHMFYLVFCHGIPWHGNKKIYHFECAYCAATTLKSKVKTILKKIYESFTWHDKARSRAQIYKAHKLSHRHSWANATIFRIRNEMWQILTPPLFDLHYISEGNGAILCYWNSIK